MRRQLDSNGLVQTTQPSDDNDDDDDDDDVKDEKDDDDGSLVRWVILQDRSAHNRGCQTSLL